MIMLCVMLYNWGVILAVQTKEAIEIFLKSRRAKGLSIESIKWYNGLLGEFARKYPELPGRPDPIYDFLSSLKSGDERRHGYYRALRALYNYFEKRLPDFPNPMKFVEGPKRSEKRPRPLTIDELNQLLSFPHKPNIKAALMFFVDTGCRLGELVNLQVADITETQWGYIARVTGKTGTRIIPISAETYMALNMVLPLGYSKYRLRCLIKFAFDDAHVKGSSINLRHSFGTYWEGDELILQNIMGHKHLETTKRYRDLRVGRMSEQHRKYSPLKMALGMTKRMEL